jgi:hypothetical protein
MIRLTLLIHICLFQPIKTTHMKEVKEMIESAFTAKDANEMLRLWASFGKISEEQKNKGYKLVKKNFEK